MYRITSLPIGIWGKRCYSFCMKTLNGNEAIAFGFKTVTSNVSFFLGIAGILFVANIVIPSLLRSSSNGESLANLVSWLISAFVTLGLARIGLLAVDKKPYTFKDFFTFGSVVVPYFMAMIIFQVAVFLGIIVFVIPGIMIAIAWMFYTYLIIDKGVQPLDAFKQSAAMTKGYRWPLFGIVLLLALINVGGALLFGIGLLITMPATAIAVAHLYRQLV